MTRDDIFKPRFACCRSASDEILKRQDFVRRCSAGGWSRSRDEPISSIHFGAVEDVGFANAVEPCIPSYRGISSKIHEVEIRQQGIDASVSSRIGGRKFLKYAIVVGVDRFVGWQQVRKRANIQLSKGFEGIGTANTIGRFNPSWVTSGESSNIDRSLRLIDPTSGTHECQLEDTILSGVRGSQEFDLNIARADARETLKGGLYASRSRVGGQSCSGRTVERDGECARRTEGRAPTDALYFVGFWKCCRCRNCSAWSIERRSCKIQIISPIDHLRGHAGSSLVTPIIASKMKRVGHPFVRYSDQRQIVYGRQARLSVGGALDVAASDDTPEPMTDDVDFRVVPKPRSDIRQYHSQVI